jgi:hypothetical protein
MAVFWIVAPFGVADTDRRSEELTASIITVACSLFYDAVSVTKTL